MEYPYAVPASYFPVPANLTSPAPVASVAAIPVPGAVATFAVVNASGAVGNSSPALWFSDASYSAIDAKQITANGTCGPNCGDLPLNWTNLSKIASFTSPVTALRLGAAGGMVIVAATVAGVTTLYNWSSATRSWGQFGPAASGQLVSLATTPLSVAFVTQSSAYAQVTTVSSTGTTLGQASIYPSGANATGIVGASLAFTPHGAAYLESLTVSVSGSRQLQYSSSLDGSHFSTPIFIGSFSNSTPGPASAIVGQTPISGSGGVPGQLALASVGAELFLLYTTNVSGYTVPAVQTSGNNGTSWDGPYLAGTTNGSVLDPSLAVGPSGLVRAAWIDPSFGSGAVEVATFLPDGMPVAPPEIPAGVGTNETVVPSAPAIAVDAFERPLVLWPSHPFNTSGGVSYTGGFFAADTSLNLTYNLANATLGRLDLSRAGGSNAYLTALLGNISTEAHQAASNVTSGNLCAAQNITGTAFYQNVTHTPLRITSGSGTVCAVSLSPKLGASPLLGAPGVFQPSTYLSVYADWALEAEAVPVAVSPLSQVTEFAPYTVSGPTTALPDSTTGSSTSNSQTDTVTVSATPYSPTAYDLAATSQIPAVNQYQLGTTCAPPPNMQRYSTTYSTTVSAWTNVSLDNGSIHSYASTSAFLSVWVTNLTPYQTYYWQGSYTAHTVETITTSNPCTNSHSTSTVTRNFAPIPLNGTFATTLSAVAGSVFVTAAFNGTQTAAQLTVRFNNTLPATVQGSLVGPTGTQTWNTTSPSIAESTSLAQWSAANQAYTLSVTSTSRPGTASPPGSPSFAYGGSGASSAEQVSTSCQFTLSTALPTVWNATGGPYSSLNATTVNVSWFSSANVLGYFTYYEVGSPINWTIAGIVPKYVSSSDWAYSVEVHGLEPLVAYNGTFGVSVNKGCLVEQDQVVAPYHTGIDPSFDTDPTLASAWELDKPYDSIAKSGGGILVGFNTPSNQSLGAGIHTLKGGYIKVVNVSTSQVLPFTPQQVTVATNGSNTLSFTPALGLNQPYSLTVVANYTYEKITIVNHKKTYTNSTESAALAFRFVYERDTSKDGLTDVEKNNGWVVLTDPSTNVTANPAEYASDGLVNDFVEKQFGLNPNTLDTAGSHMLDTWNLTFDLGSGSPALPRTTYFHYFYENSTYGFAPGAAGLANLTCLHLGATCAKAGWIGDSSPWASTVLWSAGALPKLEKLMTLEKVGWLRAVTGSYGGDRIMTVWGKLSWGANPLTDSTSNDGLADGNQTSPLGPVVVEFNVTAWNATNVGGQGTGVAPLLNVFSNGSYVYQGYAPQNKTSSNNEGVYNEGWSGSYRVSVPLVSPLQTATWQINMEANRSAGLNPLYNFGNWTTVDLFSTGSTASIVYTFPQNYWGSTQTYTAATVWLNITVVPEPKKAHTLLVVPQGNTTLSSAPWGLRHYVGETDFDLMILNLTGSTTPATVTGVASPGGGPSYNVTLTPGLNNLLVPRGIFLTSPLGQAILNQTDLNVSIPTGAGVTFAGSYWTGRTQLSASNPNLIWAFSNKACQLRSCSSGGSFGGVPGNPSLEKGVQSRQVQAVLWANISGNSDLADLLGGLVMNGTGPTTNRTWNVTNQVFDVTPYLRTLNLPRAVLNAMARFSLPSDGAYHAPTYTAPPTGPSLWSQFATAVWNTITGIATAIVNGVSKLVSVVWSVASSAAAYLGGAIQSVGTLAKQGLSDVVGALQQVEKAMIDAFNAFLAAVRAAIIAIIHPIVNSITSAITSSLATVYSSFDAGLLRVQSGSSPTSGDASAFWNAVLTPVLVATAVAAVVVVGLDILEGLTLGMSYFVGIIASIIIGAVTLAILTPTSSEQAAIAKGDSSTVPALEQFNNATMNNPPASTNSSVASQESSVSGSCDLTRTWNTLSDYYGLLDGLLSVEGGLFLLLYLMKLNKVPGIASLPVLGTIALFAWGLLGLFFAIAGMATHDANERLVFGLIGVVTGGIGATGVLDKIVPHVDNTLNPLPEDLTRLMDLSSAVIGSVDVALDWHSSCPLT